MFISLLALAMVTQKQLIPVRERGSTLYAACLADIRIMENTSTIESDIAGANECLDYIAGFNDALALTTAPICPENASLGTLVRIYVDYMQKHPKMMDTEKRLGVYGAMLQAYPCPAK